MKSRPPDDLSAPRSRAARLTTQTLAAVTRLLPVGIGVVDEGGRFVSLNEIGLKIYGLQSILDGPESLEEYLELFPLYALDGRQLAYDERPVARALNGETVIDQEVSMRRYSDREERILSFSAELFRGREQKSVVFVVHDITERMFATSELIKAHGLIQSITQGTDDLIAAQDVDYRFVFYNDAYKREFQKLWGTAIEPGTSMIDAMAPWPEEQEKAMALWRRALDGESYNITMDFGPTEKEKQVYDLRFNPIYDTNRQLIGAAHILSNVTERVQTQEALERSEMALREIDRRKDEFLATLAHELRNPLAPVRSGIELLRDSVDDQSTLDMMERQMSHLVHLVNDLLDVSRINSGKITLNREPVSLAEVVRSAREATDAAFESSPRAISVQVANNLPLVDGDPVRLVQMVSNLIGNSIKFTAPDGRIRVTADVEGDFVRIAVGDDGVGIAAEKLPRVFDLFNQGDAVEGSGLGIGLTLVRDLAILHGGRVQAVSAGLDQGSEFQIHVPIARDQATGTAGGPSMGKRAELNGRRIVIVDDNKDAALALVALLRRHGAETSAFFDGETALDQIDKLQPDTVLLDIGLPGMDGYQVAKQLRSRKGGDRLVLIAVTGWSKSEQAGDEKMFDHHMVKPVPLQALLERLTGTSAEASSASSEH